MVAIKKKSQNLLSKLSFRKLQHYQIRHEIPLISAKLMPTYVMFLIFVFNRMSCFVLLQLISLLHQDIDGREVDGDAHVL